MIHLLGSRNPFKMHGGVIGSEHLQVAGSSGYNFGGSSVTTTDTSNFISVTSTVLDLRVTKAILQIPWTLHYKHTVAGARVGFALYLYKATDGTPNGGYVNPSLIGYPDGLYVPAANEWCRINDVGAYYLTQFAPGRHALYLAMRNYTAGTLTVIQPSNDFLTAFAVGI